MSESVGFHLAHSNDSDDRSKDLKRFCIELCHHSQWKSRRIFKCGSKLDIPYNSDIAKKLGMTNEVIDIDTMTYDHSHCALHRSIAIPEFYTGDIIRIYTDDVHPGYVRLITEYDNSELLHSDLYKWNYGESKHGPAVMINIKTFFLERKYSLGKDAYDAIEYERDLISLHDIVYDVHSPYWPAGATEWITRRRSHSCPSKPVIKQIVRYGCDFVQVSHNRLADDNEWRFSFSKAEQLLIKSWTKSQRIVYGTLWGLNKRIASSNMCSYYFKTLMFWACEEKSRQFWDDDLLVHTTCELLIEMIKCVKSNSCENYFIPSNNMMDHLIDRDLSYEIGALWKTFQSRQLITMVLNICWRNELMFDVIYHIESPAWMKRGMLIHEQVNNINDNHTDLLSTDLARDLQNAIYVELSDIYRGLRFQQKSINCVIRPDKNIYFLKSESHLLLAANLCESQKRSLMGNCNIVFVNAMMSSFFGRDPVISSEADDGNVESHSKDRSTSDRQNSLHRHKEQKCLLYSRYVEEHENKIANNYYRSERITEGRKINITLYKQYSVIEMNTFRPIDVQFYKEWPGRSPTVNISWFIAKAYLANLYYTTRNDVRLTLKACDDIINVYRLSEMNDLFAQRTFPVVLSTQWTSGYDKEIQELLGFYSLSSYVFNSSSRSVYFGVCPVQFALYLKVRIVSDPPFRVMTLSNSNHHDFQKLMREYVEHMEACQSNVKVNNGRCALIYAIRNQRRQYQTNILREETLL